MATPRKNASKAEELKVSQIGDFKKRLGGILELPSGLVVRWRNPGGLRAFLAGGQIPNALMPIVEEALAEKKGVEAVDMSAILKDTDTLNEMMAMYDNIAQMCMVEPKLYSVPTWGDVEENNKKYPEAPVEEPADLIREDRLYVNELPDDDKAYFFYLLSGGVQDLARFREQQNINVGDVARVSGVAGHSVKSGGSD